MRRPHDSLWRLIDAAILLGFLAAATYFAAAGAVFLLKGTT